MKASPRWLALLPFLLSGCACSSRPYPTANPTTNGLYVRANTAADGTPAPGTIVAEVPKANGWPPTPIVTDCTGDQNAVVDLEKNLGVTSIACPMLQGANATPIQSQATPAPTESEPNGYAPRCYQLGPALLVVETVERIGGCKRIVGLAVYGTRSK